MKIPEEIKWGSLSEYSIGKGSSFIRSRCNGPKREFLHEWCKQFSKYARTYWDATKNMDAPYFYTEREMNGALLISLNQFVDACMAETRTRRENGAFRIKDRTNTHGRVDFWARYKSQDFFVETKHCYVGRNSRKPTKTAVGQLKDAIRQLRQSVRTNKDLTEYAYTPHLALLTIVLYTKNNGSKEEFSEDDWNQTIRNYFNDFYEESIEPDFIGRLIISDEVVKRAYHYNNETKNEWRYHGLLFIAKYLDLKNK